MRRLVALILFVAACGSGAGRSYPPVGSCPPLSDHAADWCDGRITKVGLIGYERLDLDVQPAAYMTYLSELSSVDAKKGPVLHVVSCQGCTLVEGKAYAARLTSDGHLFSVLVDGEELIVGYSRGPSLLIGGGGYDAAGKASVSSDQQCFTPLPAHWEMESVKTDHGDVRVPSCLAGADQRTWGLAGASERSRLPACNEQGPFENRAFTVDVQVQPSAGMSWSFEEAPAEVAHAFVASLNQTSAGHGLTFTEANGVAPDLRFTMILTEGNDGTEHDTGELDAYGLGAGDLFHVTTGDHPYNNWNDAIDRLAAESNDYFVRGWHAKAPCVDRAGQIVR